MMPRKSQKKKEDEAPAEEKKVRKKGRDMIAGGTVGTGHHEPSSDSGDPDFDINRAMVMNAKQLRFNKTAPSSKHLEVIPKPQARKTPHALTVAVVASAAAAAAEENTTGSQPQPQDQDQAKSAAKKKSRKKAPLSAPAKPQPPSPSASPTHTEPRPSDSDENEESAEEDATGRRKKDSINHPDAQ